MIDKDLIGRKSKPFRVRIEADAVRKFTEAVGIPFNNQVPPTFLGTFMEASIEGVELPQPGMIHSEQKFIYYQPVSIGNLITYTSQIKDIYQQNGKLGKMTCVILEIQGRNPVGELVFASNSTLLALE